MRLVVLLCLAAAPVYADQFQSMQNATNLGSILASEGPCGLTLDPAGIEAWIANNVAPDDMQFASTLGTMTMGQEVMISEMTASAKIAHCASVRQTATTLGLIK